MFLPGKGDPPLPWPQPTRRTAVSGLETSKDDNWSIHTELDRDLRKPWMTMTILSTLPAATTSATHSSVWLLGRKKGSSSHVRFCLLLELSTGVREFSQCPEKPLLLVESVY